VIVRAVGTIGEGERARGGSLHARIARIAVLGVCVGLLAGALPAVAGAESCPNEEVRAEQGAGRLPDCRAFELVTPEVKGDNGNFNGAYGFPDGNHVYYESILPVSGAGSGSLSNVLSTRTASGWVNTSLAPPSIGPGEPIGTQYPEGNANFAGEAVFTGDFSQAFVDSAFDTDPLDQDYNPLSLQKSTVDAYRLDLSSGAWSLAALPDTGPMLATYDEPNLDADGSFIAGVSVNGGHVFFQTYDQLPVAKGTPNEPHPNMLYDRTGGHTYVVGVLPDGKISETCGARLGDGVSDAESDSPNSYGAISPDGSNVVFTLVCAERSSGGVYLRENNATTIRLAGEGYLARSFDGSKVFTDGGGNVFEYDVATGVTSTITTEGGFVAASVDGSRVYYLTAGPNPGLYLWDNGASILIPTAGKGFANSLLPSLGASAWEQRYAVATPDGSRLLFTDTVSLTGYNSYDSSEAYVYDAATGAFTCVSCNPTGAPPLGGARLMESSHNTLLPGYSEGQISPDGSRVFFETSDALVPQDTNGLSDVYEWENGRIYLISSGQGTAGSKLSGASSNGNDVFFQTTDRLAPQDIESAAQFYDARVGGGFPYRPFIPGCDSGQCQGPQTPAPSFGAPASATFVGLGNPVPGVSAPAVKAKSKAKKCKRGFVKKRNKCVRKRTSKAAKRASGDRGVKSHA
jgi:hypothetical protein